jgi:membrane protease YdiL (CAAX protease family)
LGDDIVEAASLIASTLVLLAAVLFVSMLARRADQDQTEGRRATPMGLYIVFGGFGFFLFLFGLGSTWRSWLEGESPGTISYLTISIGLVAGLVLLPPLRKMLAKAIPFNPRSWTDTIGLLLVAAIAVWFGFALSADIDEQEPATYLYLVVTALTEVGLALVAVGVPFHRTIRQALTRLGLVIPTMREVWIALGLVIIAFVISAASSLLVQVLQPDLHDEINESLRTITSGIDTWWGAVILGLCAGAGEEVLFRGAIQPKYGIIVTAIVFAILHQQYGASFITAGVFAVGILFGLERKHLNTTACVITHAVYNTSAVLIGQAADDTSALDFIHTALTWIVR